MYEILQKHNHKMLLLGFGSELAGFYKWLIEVVQYPPELILVADQKTQKPIELLPQSQYFGGANYLTLSLKHKPDLIVKAPGIWSQLPELKEFRSQYGSDRVISSLAWFIDRFKDNIIGVTGTKGKSTTCSLIQHLLNSLAGHTVHYVGNTTGISPYTLWTDIYWQPNQHEWIVIELSSFQLQDLGFSKLSPHFSVITNYYVDHQDQHLNPKEYWQSKDQIFIHHNRLDRLVYTTPVLQRTQNSDKLVNGINIDESILDTVGQLFTLPFPGIHFTSNTSLALSTLAMTQGNLTTPQIIEYLHKNQANLQTSLNLFKGLPHRQQILLDRPVFNSKGIKIDLKIIDDGYATEPDAVAAGISTFGSLGDNMWVIMSGIDKGGEMESLQDQFTKYSQLLVGVSLFGSVGQTISNLTGLELSGQGLQKDQEKWQKEIINWLENQTQDTQLSILFSPGGSSFDEFENYTDRVNWFTQSLLETLQDIIYQQGQIPHFLNSDNKES
jgi:UDP-N-acetylmuramoylalanine-D-glutamate ligase